jgi:hypothetical protein
MPITFSGASFHLETVTVLSPGSIRVKFSQDPTAVDPTATNDALNSSNYNLDGPNRNYAVTCAAVYGDPQSIDLFLAGPLAIGKWTLSVQNIVEDNSTALSTPTSMTFLVNSQLVPDPLGHGASNDEQINVLRKFLNPALKGQGWDSMIAALAAADQRNADNARLAFDQLFLSSASGIYLERRASDEGIQKPKGVNMADDLFRQLSLTQRNGKLTQKSLLEVLEIFYGRDATRAYADTANPETYALQDGDQLVVLFEERNTVTVTFTRSHFTRIGAATAEEVAAAITRACRDAGNQGFAVELTDPITGQNKVRIYSGTLGLTSSIRIIGGSGNLQLLFPTPLFTATTSSPFATWDVSFSPTTQGNLRFTMVSSAEYNLFDVQIGDLVYIYGVEFGQVGTNGTFTIVDMSVTHSTQWFEIVNVLGTEQTGIVQVNFTDLMFFRPKRRTIYDNSRRVIVCENDGYLDIVIPATTQVVDRGPGLAAYLNPATAYSITDEGSLTRNEDVVSVDAGAPHGLSIGDQIIIDEVLPTGNVPPQDPGSPSVDFASVNDSEDGQTDSSVHSTASQTGTYQGVWSKTVRDLQGRLIVVGGATTPDGVTFTALNRVTALEDTGDTFVIGGGRSVQYTWYQVASTDGSHGFSGNHFGYRNFGASLLIDGRTLCTGGANGDDATGTASNGYDLLQFLPPLSVSQQNGTLLAARAAHGQCSLPASDLGDALISGGWTTNNVPLATAEMWNEITEAWGSVASMNVARMHHELVALDDGNFVLAIGGQIDAATTNILCRCELYNIGDDSWAFAGNMTYARTRFGVVKIPDGRVIVFGGYGYVPTNPTPATLATCEIFDPATQLWANLPSMRNARQYPVCVYVPRTNEIWVTSGSDTVVDTEVLSLSTMKWRTAAQAPLPRAHSHATGGLLADDVIAMIGGDNALATEKVNHIIVPGEDKFWLGAGLNGIHRVDDVPDSTHFTYHTDEYDYNSYVTAASGTYTAMHAFPGIKGVPGPFSYDLQHGFAITATAGTTDTVFNRGVSYPSMHLEGVDPALAFPDEEGWLVFNFGYNNVVGPVRYLGRLGNEDLILDAAVPFTETLPAGATVRLLTGRVPFEPESDQLVGNFYVTGTAAGRTAAKQIIDDIIAAGKQVLVTVIYPSDLGLGAEGYPQDGNYKLSDKVAVWGGDDLDHEIPEARLGP